MLDIGRFKFFQVLTMVGVILIGPSLLAQVQLEISRIGDATHLEFSGTTEWKNVVNKGDGGDVVVRVLPLTTDAVGKLKAHKDSLIDSIEVNSDSVDGTTELKFHLKKKTDFFDYITESPSRLVLDFFPQDPEAPRASSNTADTKDTTVKKLSGNGSQVRTQNEDQLLAKDPDLIPATTLPEKKKSRLRKPAGSEFITVEKQKMTNPYPEEDLQAKKEVAHGIFDGGDPHYRRFTMRDYDIRPEAILASHSNYYLPFPMLELESTQLRTLLDHPPEYEILPNQRRENKEARLILKFFDKKRKALLLKTAEEFQKKYPNSEYDEIIRYLVADVHYRMWKTQGVPLDFEEALGQYRYLTEKYPDSPIVPRTLLLIGYAYMDRGDHFAALQAFQRFVRLKPQSKHIDQVKISIAESYRFLHRFDDALALLEEIEKTAKTKMFKQAAALRKGDVLFQKLDFENAIKSYQDAVQRYPKIADRYPNVWYNIAEAEFRLEKFKNSLESYRVFLTKFPDHEHGGYAMTRMGELLDILGASSERPKGAFFESYFRYRSTPGAGIARIRLLVDRMPDMKEKEMKDALAEIKAITNKYSTSPTVEEKEPQEDRQVASVEAKTEGGEEGKKEKSPEEGKESEGQAAEGHATSGHASKVAMEEVEEEIKKRPVLPGIEEFSILLIADGLASRGEFDPSADTLINYYRANPQSRNKEKIIARIVRNYTEGIHQAIARNDFIEALRRYSLQEEGWLKGSDRTDLKYYVGRAYEEAGVAAEAQKIFNEDLEKVTEIRKNKDPREGILFEVIPTEESLQLRLAALALKEKKYLDAEKHISKISDDQHLTELEQIEKVEILADVAEARGQEERAKKYMTELINNWKGSPELTSPLHFRIARLLGDKKKYREASEHIQKIKDAKKNSMAVSDDLYAKALELEGDFYVRRGLKSQAVDSYSELLNAFDGKRPLASIRYRTGQLLFQDGKIKEAEKVWKRLREENDTLWRRMAEEQMNSAKWREEYKRYLDRIPAAADLQKSPTFRQ